MPVSIKTQKSRKQARAAKILKAARATVINSRRSIGSAPLATRGFYGSYSKRGRTELKVVENAVASATISTTGANPVAYNLVAQGTDFTNRVGRVINMSSILFRYFITPENTASNSEGEIVRILLVYDMQSNSTTIPAITDVLNASDVLSGVKLDNRDRFKILYDKRTAMRGVTFTAAAVTGGDPQPFFKEKFFKVNLDTVYSGTGGTIGNIATGSLLLFFVGNVGSTNTLTHYCRVRFTDP